MSELNFVISQLIGGELRETSIFRGGGIFQRLEIKLARLEGLARLGILVKAKEKPKHGSTEDTKKSGHPTKQMDAPMNVCCYLFHTIDVVRDRGRLRS